MSFGFVFVYAGGTGTGTGNVRVMTAQVETITLVGLPVESIVPVKVIRVYGTSTTATNLIGIC